MKDSKLQGMSQDSTKIDCELPVIGAQMLKSSDENFDLPILTLSLSLLNLRLLHVSGMNTFAH